MSRLGELSVYVGVGGECPVNVVAGGFVYVTRGGVVCVYHAWRWFSDSPYERNFVCVCVCVCVCARARARVRTCVLKRGCI